MSAHSSQIAEVAACHDWPNRYYHVDQILNKPGPRTDPSFAAGQEVNQSIPVYFIFIYWFIKGEGLPTKQM